MPKHWWREGRGGFTSSAKQLGCNRCAEVVSILIRNIRVVSIPIKNIRVVSILVTNSSRTKCLLMCLMVAAVYMAELGLFSA